VVTTVGPTLIDASCNVWTLDAVPGHVLVNGTGAGYTANVVEIAYVNGVIYSENASLQWYSWPAGGNSSTYWTGVSNPLVTSTPSPTPVVGNGLQFFGANVHDVSTSMDYPKGGGPFAQYFDAMSDCLNVCWNGLEPSPNSYNWSAMDDEYNYCQSHGVKMIWHAAIYGNASVPSWAQSLSGANQMSAFVTFIQAMANRYPKIDVIEAINETFTSANPGFAGTAQSGQFNFNYGWVAWIVSVCHQAWPNSVVIINDFNVELTSEGEHGPYIALLQSCKPFGLGGIGLEGYYGQGYFSPSASDLKAGLDDLTAQIGLPIYYSELTFCQTDDTAQLNQVQQLIPVIVNHPNVRGITLFYPGQEYVAAGWAWWDTAEGRGLRPAFTWLINNVPLPL